MTILNVSFVSMERKYMYNSYRSTEDIKHWQYFVRIFWPQPLLNSMSSIDTSIRSAKMFWFWTNFANHPHMWWLQLHILLKENPNTSPKTLSCKYLLLILNSSDEYMCENNEKDNYTNSVKKIISFALNRWKIKHQRRECKKLSCFHKRKIY